MTNQELKNHTIRGENITFAPQVSGWDSISYGEITVCIKDKECTLIATKCVPIKENK